MRNGHDFLNNFHCLLPRTENLHIVCGQNATNEVRVQLSKLHRSQSSLVLQNDFKLTARLIDILVQNINREVNVVHKLIPYQITEWQLEQSVAVGRTNNRHVEFRCTSGIVQDNIHVSRIHGFRSELYVREINTAYNFLHHVRTHRHDWWHLNNEQQLEINVRVIRNNFNPRPAVSTTSKNVTEKTTPGSERTRNLTSPGQMFPWNPLYYSTFLNFEEKLYERCNRGKVSPGPQRPRRGSFKR